MIDKPWESCMCVCVCVTFASCVKTNKDIFKIFSPSTNVASLHTGLQCCQPYESRSVKNKAATNRGINSRQASSTYRPRRPSSVVRTRRRRSVCDGLDVIRRRRRSTPRDTTPLVIIPFSAAVGHRRTEPGGYFC